MNRLLVHLTDAQIQDYLKRSSRDFSGTEQPRIEKHLAECELCLERALRQSGSLRSSKGDIAAATRRPDCPDEDVIRRLAAGIPFANAFDVIRHVTQCDSCGLLLKRYHDVILEEFPEEDSPVLHPSQRAGEQDLVEKNVVMPRRTETFAERLASIVGRVPPARALRWASVGMAAVALVSVGIIEAPMIADKLALNKAIKLATLAPSEQPTIEMRIPNSPYAPYQKEMSGPESPPLEVKSPSLFEAEALLARKKRAGRLDRGWLQVEGLTSLLQGNPNSAARAAIAFEKARNEGLDNPSLEIELAASYYESHDLPKTIDVLEAVLKRPKLADEEKKVALYDLAIAYEAIQSWKPAVEKWEEYLALDPASDWAKNAKSRRDKAKAKISLLRPLDRSPTVFLTNPALQSRVEEYQEIAIRYWLPQAIKDPASDAAQASRKLANALAQEHSDPWLQELLEKASRSELPALEALGKALSANKSGRYGEAKSQSKSAADFFARYGNHPGELRARFEELYANRRMLEAAQCEAGAGPLWQQLSGTKYQWLQGQLALDIASCKALKPIPIFPEAELALSGRIAEQCAFPVLKLRLLGFIAGIARVQSRGQAWDMAVKGLGQCWEMGCPPDRLYQFYSVLEQYAQRMRLLHAQEPLLEQAIAIQEAAPSDDENVILKGTLYGRLANVAITLKEDGVARESAQKSNWFLSRAPNEPYADRYILDFKTDLAEAQLRLGDTKTAVTTLETARERVRRISYEYTALKYYKVLGGAYRQTSRFDEAAAAYQEGIVIAEKGLAKLKEAQARLQWATGAEPVYRGLIVVLLEQGKDDDALRMWEWYGSRSLQPKGRPAEITWGAMQGEAFRPLPRLMSETRLIYAVFDDRLQIWTLNAKGTKGTRVNIKKAAELEQRVNDFALQCATQPTGESAQSSLEDLHKSGHELGALFLEPVLSELGPSRAVVVELDPRLSRLPVAALMDANGHYFGQEYAITSSPGMYWEENLRRPEPIGKNAPLLLADGSPQQGPGQLPKQDDLRETIRKNFLNVTLMTADKQTWSEVSRELKKSGIFVFIGHGTPDGKGTSLAFGNQRVGAKHFTPELLKRLQLATLEACSSGTGGANGLLETGNLVHPFLVAGVPSVIASRWNVDSERTADLLRSFFTHLGNGEAASQAMYHARNESLSVKDQNHPYYWAGLDLIGKEN